MRVIIVGNYRRVRSLIWSLGTGVRTLADAQFAATATSKASRADTTQTQCAHCCVTSAAETSATALADNL